MLKPFRELKLKMKKDNWYSENTEKNCCCFYKAEIELLSDRETSRQTDRQTDISKELVINKFALLV